MPSDATILSMWAHPDDESFLAAGALADAASRGCRVVSVYATRGERGWQGTPDRQALDLADVRSTELAEALAALGVDERRCLGYADGELADIPFAAALARVLAIMEELKPDVVLTFGPDGFTGHPDHKAVSAWVTAAVRRWDTAGTTVRHTAVTAGWVRRFAPALNEFNAFWPGHPVVTPGSELEWCWRLDEGLLDRKVAALRAHRSQTAHLFAAFGEPFMRAMAATEWFRGAVLRPQTAPRWAAQGNQGANGHYGRSLAVMQINDGELPVAVAVEKS
jgi:LmbE family N-acetylglucosaminyl deacetylase